MAGAINLNESVSVRLTDAGKARLAEEWGKVGMAPPEANADGTHTFPLWELANIFGSMLQMGFTGLPFESMDLRVESPGCPVTTPALFAEQMRDIAQSRRGDAEVLHSEGDDLLIQTLRLLGYGEGADVWESLPKWYA